MNEIARQARNAYQREWKRKNREKLNAYQRRWRSENPDRVRQYNEDYWTKKGIGIGHD